MRRRALRVFLALAIFALAIAAGYFVSSSFGREKMRVEAELQLLAVHGLLHLLYLS